MFFKRTVLTAGMMFASCGLCALDLQYGSLFSIRQISRQQGHLVLPLARGKYANLRILDEQTFEYLKTCSAPCRQEPADGEVVVFEIRPALTRPGMWIADVSFGGQWLITFLIFKNPNGYAVKEPENFTFLDPKLKRRVEQMLSRAAQRPATEPVEKQQ